MTHDAVDVLDGLLCLLAQIGIGISGEAQLLEMAMRYRREEAVEETRRIVTQSWIDQTFRDYGDKKGQ